MSVHETRRDETVLTLCSASVSLLASSALSFSNFALSFFKSSFCTIREYIKVQKTGIPTEESAAASARASCAFFVSACCLSVSNPLICWIALAQGATR